MKPSELIIAVDLDSVLCQEADFSVPYWDRPPYDFAIKRINELYDKGMTIMLFSSRYFNRYGGNYEKAHKVSSAEVKIWAEKHGLKYHEYVVKPTFHLLIDDKAVNVRSCHGEADWNLAVDPAIEELLR